MTTRLLEVSELRTWFGEGPDTARAVDGLDFVIHRGETFVLLGESGCGKSMTALSIMRLVPPGGHIVSGKVLLDGRDLLTLSETAMRDIRGGRIAMVFQEPQTSLNPVLTIGSQIGETLALHQGMTGPAQYARVLELLEAAGIPDRERRYHEYPHQLSGGTKQRVMLAIALAGSPELLIADEPTTALDVTIQAQVLDLLRELQRDTQMAVLLITHDLGVVAEMADRVGVMYAGHLVEQSDRETFFKRPAHPYSRMLFDSVPSGAKRGRRLAVIGGSVPPVTRTFNGCRFEPRCDSAWAACREVLPRWIPVSAEQGTRCHLHDPAQQGTRPARAEARAFQTQDDAAAPSESPDALLSVEDLKVHFPLYKGVFRRVSGYVRAVDGVSLRIVRRSTLALVGESGCGKTTAGKGILRLIAPTAGTVRFDGEDLSRLRGEALRRRRAHLQFIFQDPYASLNPRMMIADIVEEGMIAQRVGQNAKERRERVDELLRQVGLSPEIKYRYPHEFSGGQRQRICIARAIAVNPRLIICDEPTSALDVSVQAQILNLLKELQAKLDLAYLFITHNLAVVEYLAHQVAVMYLGRIVEQGTVEEVLRSPKHPYTRALLAAVPVIDGPREREIIRLAGDLPSPADPPSGCHFHPRCREAMPGCQHAYPGVTAFSETHATRCFLYARETETDPVAKAGTSKR